MELKWIGGAWEEYLRWFERDKKAFKKINNLIKSIRRNGYNCEGKPEPLRGNFIGWWSVKINHKDRLVFRIENDELIILQCENHYLDK